MRQKDIFSQTNFVFSKYILNKIILFYSVEFKPSTKIGPHEFSRFHSIVINLSITYDLISLTYGLYFFKKSIEEKCVVKSQ